MSQCPTFSVFSSEVLIGFGDIGDSHVGLQARMLSQALRILTSEVSNKDCTVIFINQLREKVGVQFGSPETTPGGRALKFYSSVRLDVRRIGQIKDKDGQVVGGKTRVKVVKNKIAPPHQIAEFDILFSEGASKYGDLVDIAESKGIINRSGAWYSMGDERLGQGRENVKSFLKEHADICSEIENKVREAYGLKLSDNGDEEPAEE